MVDMQTVEANTQATLTTKGFCAYLGISEPTALAILNKPGFYPAIRVGRKHLVVKALLDQYLAENAGKDLLA